MHLAWFHRSAGQLVFSFLLGKDVTKAVPTCVPPTAVRAGDRKGAKAPWCRKRFLFANLSSDLNFLAPGTDRCVSQRPQITLGSEGNWEKQLALRIKPVGLMVPSVRPGCCTGPGFCASPILIRVFVKRMALMASTETSTCKVWALWKRHSLVLDLLLVKRASMRFICSSIF